MKKEIYIPFEDVPSIINGCTEYEMTLGMGVGREWKFVVLPKLIEAGFDPKNNKLEVFKDFERMNLKYYWKLEEEI